MGTLAEMIARQRAEKEKKESQSNAISDKLAAPATGSESGGRAAAPDRSDAGQDAGKPIKDGTATPTKIGFLASLNRNQLNPAESASPAKDSVNVVRTDSKTPDDLAADGRALADNGAAIANQNPAKPAGISPEQKTTQSATADKPQGLGFKLPSLAGGKPSTANSTGSNAGDSRPVSGLAKLANLSRQSDNALVREAGTLSNALQSAISGGSVTAADLLDSDDAGTLTESASEFAYPDQIPATAPDRELPEDLSEQQQQFITTLNGIYSILYDPELFGQMIRTIMQELQENPEYEKLLCDDDVATMMRGLRESMGMAKIKKAEKSRGAGKAKTPGAKANQLLDMMGGDVGFSDEDFA